MAITLVDHIGAASADTFSVTTGAINSTGANFLAAAVADLTTHPGTDPSDSKGNSWTVLTETTVSNVRLRLMYAKNATTGSGHTFTASSAEAEFPAAAFAAFANVHTVTPFDVENGGSTSGGTTVQPGSITPGTDHELVLTGVGISGTPSTMSIDGGYTITDEVDFNGGVNFGVALAYLVQTSAAATNPTWTGTAVTSYAARIASFLEAVTVSRRFILHR
jgi:hypothetical protein